MARSSAVSVRAVVGTTVLARPQQLRAMYQLQDADGNTRVSSPNSHPSLHYAGGSVPCYAPDSSSGIGECRGTLSSGTFASGGAVPLSLHWPDSSTVALPSFASVTAQREPSWSQSGEWNTPAGAVSEAVRAAISGCDEIKVPSWVPRGEAARVHEQ